jgi:hypothetical protein
MKKSLKILMLCATVVFGVNNLTAVTSAPLKFEAKVVKAKRLQASSIDDFLNGTSPAWKLRGTNGVVSLQLSFKKPIVVNKIRLSTLGEHLFLKEVEVSPDGKHFRKLLGRWINLPAWKGGGSVELDMPPATVGKYLRLNFQTGITRKRWTGLKKLEVIGYENKPERHMLCWASNFQRDYLNKLDYLDKELGVTDLWLDYIETAFPQTNMNSGLNALDKSKLLQKLKERNIRYWLGEHESFGQLVQKPEDLANEKKWLTTLREMRRIYTKAKKMGFRGIVFDAEDYDGVPKNVKHKYEKELDFADHADAWTFKEEIGPTGLYYRRGLEVGKLLHEVWPQVILMQLYEARMYAGKNNCRDGNYWWLKGIFDGGVKNIWIATEKTYGAGKGEIRSSSLKHLHTWFVKMPTYIPRVFESFPFATRVLPGFHPWNSRLRSPNYQPRYLDEQLRLAAATTPAYWIYTEGTFHGGDPRDVLDRKKCKSFGVTPEQYLAVFAKHQTERKPE